MISENCIFLLNFKQMHMFIINSEVIYQHFLVDFCSYCRFCQLMLIPQLMSKTKWKIEPPKYRVSWDIQRMNMAHQGARSLSWLFSCQYPSHVHIQDTNILNRTLSHMKLFPFRVLLHSGLQLVNVDTVSPRNDLTIKASSMHGLKQ